MTVALWGTYVRGICLEFRVLTNRVVLHGVLSPLCGILRIVIPKYFYPQPDCPNFKNVVKKFGNKKLMPIFAVPIAEIAQLVEHDLFESRFPLLRSVSH